MHGLGSSMSSTIHHLRRAAVLTALVLLALSVTGCAGGAAWGATLAALMSLSMLFASGCGMSHGRDDDAGPVADAGRDARVPGFDAGLEGTWETCCVEGRIDSCFCEAGWSCNYGWFTDCGGGTCSYTPEECPADAGVPDAGLDGTWEPCCNAGLIESCFCPAGFACNYGWYNDCGDGTCTELDIMCPVPAP